MKPPSRCCRTTSGLLALLLGVTACAAPPPPDDPLAREVAAMSLYQQAALTVAAPLELEDDTLSDRLRAEIETGSAGGVLLRGTAPGRAARALDSLRAAAPWPLLAIVDPGEPERHAAHQSDDAALPVAPCETGARPAQRTIHGRSAIPDLSGLGPAVAVVRLPDINREQVLHPRRLDLATTAVCTAGSLRRLQQAGTGVALGVLGLPDTLTRPLHWDRARLEALELRELALVLERGGAPDAVLLSPARIPALTGDTLPLPLSAPAISGLVRRDLGFDGVVMAELGPTSPLARERPVGEAAVALLTAGTDLLLGVQRPAAVVDAIVAAVASGALDSARVAEASTRVLRLRRSLETADSTWIDGSGRLDPDIAALIPPGEAADRPRHGSAPAAPVLRAVPADSVAMDPRLGATIDDILEEALADSVFTGAAVAIGRRGGLVLLRGYGTVGRGGAGAPVSGDRTIFDLASLTKVVGTTTAAALLVEDGRLDPQAPVREYLPAFRGDGREEVRIIHLLTHTAGLPSGLWLFGNARSPDEALKRVMEAPLVRPPGERVLYSDLGMILLAEVVERVAEMPIDRLLARRVFAPLGMQSTMYLPPMALREATVPTAELTERDFPLQAIVHDANAFRLGGVAGHAGLFSTARDLAVFAQMMLNGGSYGPLRILSPETVEAFTRPRPGAGNRALGWDTPSRVSSAGAYFSARSFGHTGYTGTSLWIDPELELFVVLLTNRTYTRATAREILQLRAAVHDAAARAVGDRPVRRR